MFPAPAAILRSCHFCSMTESLRGYGSGFLARFRKFRRIFPNCPVLLTSYVHVRDWKGLEHKIKREPGLRHQDGAGWNYSSKINGSSPKRGTVNLHFLFVKVINYHVIISWPLLSEDRSWSFREFFILDDSDSSSLMRNGSCDVSRTWKIISVATCSLSLSLSAHPT